MKHLEFIKVLQNHYNILVLFHPSSPEERRVFVVNQFTPVQGLNPCLDLQGKEITELLESGFTQFGIARQTGTSINEFKESQFETKLDEIPKRHYQFDPTYCWEWYLSA